MIWLITLLVSCSLMVLVFLYARVKDNASWVDVAWSFGLAALAGLHAFFGDGWQTRRWALAIIVGAWGVRLGSHLAMRVASHPEEGRYITLRAAFKPHVWRRFFFFYQYQALANVLLALPFFWIASNPATQIELLEWVGLAIWCISFTGESLADRQLKSFKAKGAGGVCQEGLWAWSRHPNYFFEWLIWVGLACASSAVPWGWTGWLSPLVMLFLLLKVTGIPPTEAQCLNSKGEAYKTYQRRTSAFFPRPPKSMA
ncbi:MAG: DUF1295 domain-containing protein [Acidobacteria bacterium]|nr:DUF1295 domain-containing protein [Acidobacteriota bacterium]